MKLAAENLRAQAIEWAGGYSDERIWNWMARHESTLAAVAEALGLSCRALAFYRSGKKVSRLVAWACLGWEVEAMISGSAVRKVCAWNARMEKGLA